MALFLVGASIAALLPAPALDASFGGAWDKRTFGCNCHAGEANPAVAFNVTGFPSAYELGAAYTITVEVTATPVESAGPSRAGFNAEVLQGSLSVPGAWADAVQAYGNQASHTPNGTRLSAWQFLWLAPATPSGVVFLWVTVNTVDGNGAPGPPDAWAQKTLESKGVGPDTGAAGRFLEGGTLGGVQWPVVLAAVGASGAAAVTIGVWRGRLHLPLRRAAGRKRHGRAAKRARREQAARARRHASRSRRR